MKAMMIFTFFSVMHGIPQISGADSQHYETLDDCIYDLVAAQELNKPELLIIAACVELKEPRE